MTAHRTQETVNQIQNRNQQRNIEAIEDTIINIDIPVRFNGDSTQIDVRNYAEDDRAIVRDTSHNTLDSSSNSESDTSHE